MNVNDATTGSFDYLLETFAAELTDAAYPVALRHGTGDKWLDLELDLWRALADTIKKWVPELSQAALQPDAVLGDVRDRLDHRRRPFLALTK